MQQEGVSRACVTMLLLMIACIQDYNLNPIVEAPQGGLPVDTMRVFKDTGLDDAPEMGVVELDTAPPEVVVEVINDPKVGDLIFSEIMVQPTVAEDVDGEWVELYNTSGYGIQIQGYSFHDDDYDRFVIEDDYVVMPEDYIVLCANVNPSQNGGVPCDVGFNRTEMGGDGAMALGNKGDEVVLSLPDGTEIDWLYYDAEWYAEGIASGLDPDHLDGEENNQLMYWCEQTTVVSKGGEHGTPGMRNDDC